MRRLVLVIALGVLSTLAVGGSAIIHRSLTKPETSEWTWWSATVDGKLLVIIATCGKATSIGIADPEKDDDFLYWDDNGDGHVDRIYRNGQANQDALTSEERKMVDQRFAALKEKFCKPEFLDNTIRKDGHAPWPMDLQAAAHRPRQELVARGRPFRLFIFYLLASIYQSRHDGQTRVL
jgi:hypothetical protein